MAVGRSRSKATSVPVTPAQSQQVAHEEESGGSDVGDQENENDSLKKEVKDLSVKLKQVISVLIRENPNCTILPLDSRNQESARVSK